MIKVYTASKLNKAEMWKQLIHTWPEVEFTARWPVNHVGEIPDDEAFASIFWVHDYEDVFKADVVLVYGIEGDKLRGALVEAGMGIAFGKTVIVIGEHPDYGTWKYHPQVYRVKDLESARILIGMLEL